MVAFKGVWTQAFWKAVTAEFLAMLIFVLLSLGSTINWGGTEKPLPVDMVLISLCFGLSIATMVQCFGHISGGHINPAVTVAMVCTRKISIAKSVFYIAAQCLGAIIGAGILYLVTPPSVVGGLGVTMVIAGAVIFKQGRQASGKLSLIAPWRPERHSSNCSFIPREWLMVPDGMKIDSSKGRCISLKSFAFEELQQPSLATKMILVLPLSLTNLFILLTIYI